jgi:hypothetical protein
MDNLQYFNNIFNKQKPEKPKKVKEKDVFANSKKPNKVIK